VGLPDWIMTIPKGNEPWADENQPTVFFCRELKNIKGGKNEKVDYLFNGNDDFFVIDCL
jgi:hypothetical protein